MSTIEQQSAKSDESQRFTDEDLLDLRLDGVLHEVILPILEEGEETHDLNDWQRLTLTELSNDLGPDQTVDLPTRTGKSHLIRRIALQAAGNGISVAILAPRRHILNEHGEEIEALSTETVTVNGKNIEMHSTQKMARSTDEDFPNIDGIDLVLIDEGHKALGQATVAGIRRQFPNAVRMTFTATPDYAQNRSVTDEYGPKVVSKSIVEAVERGKVPPIRSFLYKTQARIPNLDPNNSDFTVRELKRLAQFSARNAAIIDMAEDLVAQGRQGLITTIPGGDLLHAEILATELTKRAIEHDGIKRPLRVVVARGSDEGIQQAMQDFESGEIDILLYCDLLREGYTTNAASFLINGRPTTSIVNITQDVGRILQPKDEDVIAIDFLDDSVKHQCTIFDVLQLDRATQAHASGPRSLTSEANTDSNRDTYMRGIFRKSIVEALGKYDKRLISELYYKFASQTPHERRQNAYHKLRAEEFAREAKIWGKILEKEGLGPEPADDLFMIPIDNKIINPINTDDLGEGYTANLFGYTSTPSTRKDAWIGLGDGPLILPTVSFPDEQLEDLRLNSRIVWPETDPQELATGSGSKLHTHIVNEALTQLTEQEQRIIRLRFGLYDGGGASTLDEVGAMEQLSRERIRQLEARAMAKLRGPGKIDSLVNIAEESSINDEPTREDILAYRALLKSLDDMDNGIFGSSKPQNSATAESIRVGQNKELIKRRNSYYRTLSMTFYDRLNDFDDVHSAHAVVDMVAQEMEGYSPNNYTAHERIVRILGRKFQRIELVDAANLIFNSKPYNYYYMTQVEAQELRAQLDNLKSQLLSALSVK